MASDVSDAAVEAAKLAWKLGSAAADVVTFMTESSDELPLLQPALGTLAIIREKVETVQSIPEECAALGERCTYLTACVIVKCRRVSAGFDVAPLDDCLREVAKFVERCGRRGRVSRVLKASHDKAEIARFNASLDRLAGDLGLAGIATVEQKVDTILVRHQRLLFDTDSDHGPIEAILQPRVSCHGFEGSCFPSVFLVSLLREGPHPLLYLRFPYHP